MDNQDHTDIYQQLGLLSGRMLGVEGGVHRIETKLDAVLTHAQNEAVAIASFKGRVIGVASVISIFTGAAASWMWNKLTGA